MEAGPSTGKECRSALGVPGMMAPADHEAGLRGEIGVLSQLQAPAR